MGRIHLFEFEDQKWFPSFIRNYGTDFLQFISNKINMYKPIVHVIEKGLNKSNTNQIIDIGSGGGGGLIWLNSELKNKFPDLKITLTDYHPNIPAFEFVKKQADNFNYVKHPVDARNVPTELQGLRTQFLSLHHFKPKDAVLILQNAVDSGNPIGIFETYERSVGTILKMLISPLTVFLSAPFIRPFKPGRIVFSNLIPIVPLFIMWDGLVSTLRTYSVKEMNVLVAQVNGNEKYDWEIGKTDSKSGIKLYLLGTKKEL